MTETLNIFTNIRVLLLKTLNTYCCHRHAAQRLGVDVRSLPRMKRDYGIIKEGDRWIFEEDEQPKPGHRVVWFNTHGQTIQPFARAHKGAHH